MLSSTSSLYTREDHWTCHVGGQLDAKVLAPHSIMKKPHVRTTQLLIVLCRFFWTTQESTPHVFRYMWGGPVYMSWARISVLTDVDVCAILLGVHCPKQQQWQQQQGSPRVAAHQKMLLTMSGWRKSNPSPAVKSMCTRSWKIRINVSALC